MPSPIEKSRFSDAIYHSSFCFLLQVQCLQVDSNVRNLRKISVSRSNPAVRRSVYLLHLVGFYPLLYFSIFVRKSMVLKFGEIRTNLF